VHPQEWHSHRQRTPSADGWDLTEQEPQLIYGSATAGPEPIETTHVATFRDAVDMHFVCLQLRH